jgi:hypothetical protein
MENSSEQMFRQQVRACLHRLTPELVTALTALIRHSYPPEVVWLDFEIFSDSFCSGFPVRAFFLDASNTEFFLYVDGEATYPSPIDPGLLDIAGVYPEQLEVQLANASPECDAWSAATLELVSWFQACWDHAGGREFRLFATIAEHDSSDEINLISGVTQRRGAGCSA